MKTAQQENTFVQLESGTAVRVMKRLQAAVGYHELGMTQHALQCLTSLWELGDIGPFRAAQRILRTAILGGSDGYSGIAKALEDAANTLPPPQRQALWQALHGCYRPLVDMPRTRGRRGHSEDA